MQKIGSVTADELNRTQQAMEDYIIANNIPGAGYDHPLLTPRPYIIMYQ